MWKKIGGKGRGYVVGGSSYAVQKKKGFGAKRGEGELISYVFTFGVV